MATQGDFHELRKKNKSLKEEISSLKNNLTEKKHEAKLLKESMENWKLIVQNVPELVIQTDRNFKILYLNRTFSGRKTDEVIGTEVLQYLPEEERNKVKIELKTVLRTGKGRVYKSYFVEPKGSRIWVESQVSLYKYQGKAAGLIITTSNITARINTEEELQRTFSELELGVKERTKELTEANKKLHEEIEERRKAEKALRNSEERLRTMMDSSPDSITLIDAKAVIVECNQTTLSIFGYESKKEIIGRNVFEFVAPQDRVLAMENFKKRFKNRIDQNIEYFFTKKDGTIFPVEVSLGSILDASGNISGFVTLAKDITERKMSETALRQKTIAMGEIIAQIEVEKKRIQEDISTNVGNIISPILDQLPLTDTTEKHIKLLRHHLDRLTSPFGTKITDRSLNITPRELDICNMVKGGLSSKDISQLLNISPTTVSRHRRNIRKKLGIANKDINLYTYLQTLSA